MIRGLIISYYILDDLFKYLCLLQVFLDYENIY